MGMSLVKRGLVWVSLMLSLAGVAWGQAPATAVQDTVYRADGTPAGGSVVISWPAFTTADGTAIPAGSSTTTLGAGGALSVSLVPNASATPIGSFYTAVFHLNDGTVSREFWVVPVTVPGGGPARLAGIRNQVLPTSVAMQAASKVYVDTTVARAVAGFPPTSMPWVLKTGDTMSGPLVLPGDPTSDMQAADKHYVDASAASTLAAATSGPIAPSRLPVFGASGAGHAVGAVPDPGATAGSSRYLREDGAWGAPAGGGGGSMVYPGAGVAVSTGSAWGTPLAAPSGTLVGTTDTQTLSNKTLTGATLSSPTMTGVAVVTSTSTTNLQANGVGAATSSLMQANAGSTALSGGAVDTRAYGESAAVTLFGSSFAGGSLILAQPNTHAGLFGVGNYANADFLLGTNNAERMRIKAGGNVNVGGNASPSGLFSVGASSQFQVSSGGDVSAPTYAGPASAPSGTCPVNGLWVFSQDGHATFCSAGSWVTKI